MHTHSLPTCYETQQAVKELQTSAREAIILLKAMIGEVRANVDEEDNAICALFNSMQVRCTTQCERISSILSFSVVNSQTVNNKST